MSLPKKELDDIKNDLLKYVESGDCDEISYKEKIKEKLYNNKYIIHVLNNPDLDESEPDSYLGVNILPYYLIKPTQTKINNFICYEVGFEDVSSSNEAMKLGQITFTVMCDQKNNIDEDTGVARHDLLSMLLIREFNWTSIFGTKLKLISDKPSVIDSDYNARILIFEQITTNSLTRDKVMINKRVESWG